MRRRIDERHHAHGHAQIAVARSHHRAQRAAFPIGERHRVFAPSQIDRLDRQGRCARRRQGTVGIEQCQALLGQCERRPPTSANRCRQHEIDVGQAIAHGEIAEPSVAPIVLQQAARGTQPELIVACSEDAGDLRHRQSVLAADALPQSKCIVVPLVALQAAETRYPQRMRRSEDEGLDRLARSHFDRFESSAVPAPELSAIRQPWLPIGAGEKFRVILTRRAEHCLWRQFMQQSAIGCMNSQTSPE